MPFLIPGYSFLLRGVVQLFNAVRKNQKTINTTIKEVGGSERKKAKLLSSVSKKDFIDVLRRTEGGHGVASATENDIVCSLKAFCLFCFTMQNYRLLFL